MKAIISSEITSDAKLDTLIQARNWSKSGV
jgi:hypothetical protein